MSSARHRREGLDTGPVLFVLGVVVGLLAALISDRVAATLADRDIELVRAVRNLAMEDYVDEVGSSALIDDALSGMLEGLDRYSRFYDAEEIAQLDRETYGEFRGIGVVFRRPTREGQVLFPFPGSPAERAGLRVGDRILEIDGRSVAAMETGGLQRSIQQAPREDLDLLIAGLDGEERHVVVQPERVLDPTVRHSRLLDTESGIGYLAILSFSHRTPEEFDAAVSDLRDAGLRALVVDLRMNPGGILDAAVKVANRFISEGPIVATRTREETLVTEADPAEAQLADLPLVLLVDEASASASEVLAGALQDHCVAALVGEPTYGKGTVQTLRRLRSDRGIVKLTTATYFTPAWRRIERRDDGESGIAPDVLVELPQAERSGVYEFLASYSPPAELLPAIRAWERSESRELVSLPPSDRQLEAAVALLEGERRDVHEQRAH